MAYNQDTVTGPSFSFQNRLARLVWNLASLILIRYSPKPMHGYRSLVLRAFGARIGSGVHVYPKVKIWAPWNLELGDQCGVANGVTLYSQGKISIGRRAIVSQGAHLVAGTHDHTKSGFPLITKPIKVGDNVWIAAEAFVHPGVTIGNGSVIAARAVVTKDMPEWMICGGHPCVPLKERRIEGMENH